MQELAEGAQHAGFSLICVGDRKSPLVYDLAGCRFVSLEEQLSGIYELGKKLPVDHYCRKNIGYLLAISQGVPCILETDDDNLPLPGFWAERNVKVAGCRVKRRGWANAFRYFTDQLIWPRGFPLDCALDADTVPAAEFDAALADCPVQQSLANGDTDVDAVYRLTRGDWVTFEEQKPPLILDQGVWCPFNSQNTFWWNSAFELLYLPSYCSFRMTDIWRSFVVQACLWANGWRLAFLGPTVRQERNPHNLMCDFEAEIPGYLNNRRIAENLQSLPLKPGAAEIQGNMIRCYTLLVEMGLIGRQEFVLLDAWFSDLERSRKQGIE